MAKAFAHEMEFWWQAPDMACTYYRVYVTDGSLPDGNAAVDVSVENVLTDAASMRESVAEAVVDKVGTDLGVTLSISDVIFDGFVSV